MVCVLVMDRTHEEGEIQVAVGLDPMTREMNW